MVLTLMFLFILLSTSVSRADNISANFNAVQSPDLGPLAVKFTDTSTGNATSWSWDFGDGTTSNERNPVHKYTAAGNYNVTLTVSNSDGSSTNTKASKIDVYSAPVANFK
ncbi:MAG: PKD domain-containing protein, partial [Alphaproteobacteria bacterium]